jgi:hypothetical protein
MPPNGIPLIQPRCVALKSNDRPQAGKTSCRITNENAEATRATQLAMKSRRGFMRENSEATRAPPHDEDGWERP